MTDTRSLEQLLDNPPFLQIVSLAHLIADDTRSAAAMSYVGAKDFLRKFQAHTWNPIGVFISGRKMRIYEFRTYRLDAAERLLLREGKVVPLQPKAFDLLLVLVEHHGRLRGKDELMKLVWHDAVVEEADRIQPESPDSSWGDAAPRSASSTRLASRNLAIKFTSKENMYVRFTDQHRRGLAMGD